MKIKGAILLGLTSLFITSCDSESVDFKGDFDRTNEELHITVTWYDTQKEVDKAYVEEFGRARDKNSINRNGFAVWANPGLKPHWCRIYSVKPTRIDDHKTTTLGHELTHCLIGTYHPEPN
jgi:hypothetical protein